MDRFDEVKEILVDVLGERAENIELDTDLMEDLGADSLDLVEVTMAIEDNYEIEIADEDIAQIRTFEDVLKALDRVLGDQ